MIDKLKFIELLVFDLIKNVKLYAGMNPYKTFMNLDCGKTALKRKITLLRRELLVLERMIDE